MSAWGGAPRPLPARCAPPPPRGHVGHKSARGTCTRCFPAPRRRCAPSGAEEIWLFGSLVAGEVHKASDVRLAVGGMSGEAYVAALGLMSLNLPCSVDLVRLEEAAPAFGDRIRREGLRR